MKVGLSSYSLSRAISAGEMDIISAIQWIAENGGQHVEIVPERFTVSGNDALIKSIVTKTKELGMEVSSYTIGANFVTETEADYKNEIKRVKKEVDVAAALGVKYMRHDVASRKPADATIENFDKDLPKVTEACQHIADYAKKFGIITSIENHGYHFQASERIQRLIKAVDRENFRTTLDVGNFLCVDEDPVAAVKNNIKYASIIHLKDFYVRTTDRKPGEGWLITKACNYLRGAIVGHGDINIPYILKIIKESGYNGFLSIEFEGMEECRFGSKASMDNVKSIWALL